MVGFYTVGTYRRRPKKLRAAARCSFPDAARVAFDCGLCSWGDKEQRGCIEPINSEVWKITPCYKCGGRNKDCAECNGSNIIRVGRCPRAIAEEARWVFDLLPFFYDYYGALTNKGVAVWPDGKGRYYQPKKLQLAFDVLLSEYMACHKQDK